MSDESLSEPPQAKQPGPGARVLGDLSALLTADEKKIRDIELAEQARRFFGGLTEDEKRLLGMDAAPAASAIREERAEAPQAAAHPRRPLEAADVLTVFFSVAAFAAILVWVLSSR